MIWFMDLSEYMIIQSQLPLIHTLSWETCELYKRNVVMENSLIFSRLLKDEKDIEKSHD